MKRREFLKRCSLAVGSMAALASGARAGGIEFANNTAKLRIGAKRYNVLFILVDQWRYCSLSHGAHHDKLVQTPNLDKVAKEGAHWASCYATHPVCTPNRSSIITGRWPWQTGMNANSLMLPPWERCIADEFTDAGYNCHYIGKWHMNGEGKEYPNGYVPQDWHRRGFTTFEGYNRGHVYWYGTSYMMTDDGTEMSTLGLYPDDTYEPTYQADLAIKFMKQNKNHPFFCYLSWGPPHTPYLEHPPEFSYDAADVVVRPNVPLESVATAQNTLRSYFAHCTAMDREIGRLIDTLEKEGLAEDTLVVFTADHGDMHRSHNMEFKGHPEEESWHIPLLMRLPGKIKPGHVVDNPISSADLMPTIMSVCGLGAATTCTGKDKSAAMSDAGLPDESIYGGVKNAWRAVVKGDYKLVVEGEDGIAEIPVKLYNLKTDPYEMSNLINDPDYNDTKTDLLAEIDMWKTKTDDVFPAWPWQAKASY